MDSSSWALSLVSIYSWVAVIFVLFVNSFLRRVAYFTRCAKVAGPPAQIPLFGSITDLPGNADLLKFIGNKFELYKHAGSVMRLWIGPYASFFLRTASAAKILLSGNEHNEKSAEYRFLYPWLNMGLLTSSGKKWHTRRKMITPAFHFNILEEFIHVFNGQSDIMVHKLKKAIENSDSFDIYPFITRCTLDIICETAMGCNVNAQGDDDSEYLKSICRVGEIAYRRSFEPILQPEWLFNLTKLGRVHKESLKVLHGFTDEVIRERQLAHKTKNDVDFEDELDKKTAFPKKRAFLDLLIEASDNRNLLSDADIREEVDTFMFEGHDTTSVGITWALFLIGHNPNVQEKIHEELVRVFGDSDRPVTMSDLNELKYLECCIKETLRLYPSVPAIGRTLSEDTIVDGNELPAGSTVNIMIWFLHRDPSNFPEPHRFIPERFLPENCQGRHPYAYVPFSAGPRNCIGQKFALMEEKVVLSSLLRNFRINSLEREEDLVLLPQLVIRSGNGVRLRIQPR